MKQDTGRLGRLCQRRYWLTAV